MNYGKCDFRQLIEFQNKIEKLEENKKKVFLESCVKEIASRLLSQVIPRTPVGNYPEKTGKTGGTLRRGWKSLKIDKKGDTFTIEIINPIEYASYVEYGHRKRNNGWHSGKFMLSISESIVNSRKNGILEIKLNKFLEEVFS